MSHTAEQQHMTALLATIRKECLLLARDVHGLALLFLMPVAFIIIMSLALQEQFAHSGSKKIAVLFAATAEAADVMATLQQRDAFSWEMAGNDAATRVERDEAAFLLTLRAGQKNIEADILVAPGTSAQNEAIFTATVGEALGKQRVETLLRELKMKQAMSDDFSLDNDIDSEHLRSNPVQVRYSYRNADDSTQQPTSVQQSVPAWLVFAMFFSVVPLANTLISERQQGTLRRLRTLPISPSLPIIGKLLPYFFINQIQVLLMLAVGVWLMPLLGADSLTLGHSIGGLMLMATSLSIAALGYGILIAVIARTTDQAATLGGVGNILLAAIGGVMVPRFVMPETMQRIAEWSPMAWGLDGFLDLFLRGGGMHEVLPEAGALFLFGAATIALALLLARHRS